MSNHAILMPTTDFFQSIVEPRNPAVVAAAPRQFSSRASPSDVLLNGNSPNKPTSFLFPASPPSPLSSSVSFSGSFSSAPQSSVAVASSPLSSPSPSASSPTSRRLSASPYSPSSPPSPSSSASSSVSSSYSSSPEPSHFAHDHDDKAKTFVSSSSFSRISRPSGQQLPPLSLPLPQPQPQPQPQPFLIPQVQQIQQSTAPSHRQQLFNYPFAQQPFFVQPQAVSDHSSFSFASSSVASEEDNSNSNSKSKNDCKQQPKSAQKKKQLIFHLAPLHAPIKLRRQKLVRPDILFCRICGTTATPEWRRGPDNQKSLCNACGLRFAKMIKREKQTTSSPDGSPCPSSSFLSLDRTSVHSLLN